MSSIKPISTPAASESTKSPRGCLIFMGLLFGSVGFLGFGFGAVLPIVDHVSEKGWQVADATIVSSEVNRRIVDSDSVYDVEVQYTYSYAEREWNNATWRSHASSFSTLASAEAVRDRYRVGEIVPCYVNPDNPDAAVLDRSFPWSSLWVGAIALIFGVAGLAMIWVPLRGSGRENQNLPPSAVSLSEFDSRAAPWQAFEGPRRLKPLENKWVTFFLLLFFSAFWNGISWTLFVVSIREGVLFATIFLLLFVGIGALLIWSTFYQMMQLMNPKVSVAMSSGAVVPGESVHIAWEVAKNAQRLRRLTLSMIGEEVVTYTRGTSTATDTNIFQRIPIAVVTSESEMRFSSASVTLPSTMVHSFSAPNNEIRWSIEVVGVIRLWPDVYQKMPFGVCPTPVSSPPLPPLPSSSSMSPFPIDPLDRQDELG